MKKKLRKYLLGSQELTPNPYTGLSSANEGGGPGGGGGGGGTGGGGMSGGGQGGSGATGVGGAAGLGVPGNSAVTGNGGQNAAPKGAGALGGVTAGINAIGSGIQAYNSTYKAPSTIGYNARERKQLKTIEKGKKDSMIATTAGSAVSTVGAFVPIVGPIISAVGGIIAAGGAGGTAAWNDKELDLDRTFKARVTRDQNEAEAQQKMEAYDNIGYENTQDLRNTEGLMDPRMSYGKYGGRMPVYGMGGPRIYQKPNAELEDGEVIMRNGGGVKLIKGDRHEEGGEDEYLAPGDFVWSDHLKYKGKSMAELYLMVKNNPEKVNQLKDLQEDLASKEEPSEYNDLPQAKYGGGLPKYKKGTPKTPAPIGVNSKSKTWFNEYGEYILPAASAVGQIVNLALAKDPYEDMKVPAAKKIGSSQQISLARTNAQAEMDANEAGAADARRSALYTGSGPGSTAIYQTIANQQAGLNSKAQNEANRINMSIAAEEARLNSEDKYRRESFNAGAENETAKLRYDKNVNQAAYKAATTASYGNIFAGIANDAQSFMRDKAVARSITRGTNIDRNRYAMNLEAIEKAARDEETENANKAKRDFSEDEYLKLYTKKIGEINTYLSKRD